RLASARALLEPLGQRLQALHPPRRQRHMRAAQRQRLGDSLANARAGARHQRYLPTKVPRLAHQSLLRNGERIAPIAALPQTAPPAPLLREEGEYRGPFLTRRVGKEVRR